MLKLLKLSAPDLLLVSGAAGVFYGCWLIYQPLGYIVAGALMIYAGLRLA
jgi:hypothetical protein